MSEQMIVGIDPGLHGAVVGIADGKGVFSFEIPTVGDSKARDYDVGELAARMRSFFMDETTIYLEEAIGWKGFKAGRSLGRFQGIIEGIVAAHPTTGWKLRIVRPQLWQKAMLAGTNSKLPAKARAKIAAQREFGAVGIGDKTEGEIDAALIALYGQRQR